jgi:hypothetical protein
MAGASKPKRGSKVRAVRAQDGARKGGGINTRKHAGPVRKSKTPPSGTKGAQLQRRIEP